MIRGRAQCMLPKIYIIGVTHTSKKDGAKILKKAEELRPQAIFIEKFKNASIDTKKSVLIILRNPVFFFGTLIYLGFLKVLAYFSRTRLGEYGIADTVYTSRASKKIGVPVYNVDDDIYEMTFSRSALWTLVSWAILVFPLVWIWIFPISTIIVTLWYFVFLGIFYVMFIRFGVPIRNRNMRNRIKNSVEKFSYHSVFLVTGKLHVSNFKEILSPEFHVEVL